MEPFHLTVFIKIDDRGRLRVTIAKRILELISSASVIIFVLLFLEQ